MQPSLFPLPFAAFLGLEPWMISIVVPVAGIIFGVTMALGSMYFEHRRRELWHQTARLALEKGQPLPPQLADDQQKREPRTPAHDARNGLVLIATGAGLWLMLGAIAGEGVRTVGAIPIFIGVALLLFALGSVWSGRKTRATKPADDASAT